MSIFFMDETQSFQGKMGIDQVNGSGVGLNQVGHSAGSHGFDPGLLRGKLVAQQVDHPVDQPAETVQHSGVDGRNRGSADFLAGLGIDINPG